MADQAGRGRGVEQVQVVVDARDEPLLARGERQADVELRPAALDRQHPRVSPGSSSPWDGAFWSTNITWNTGEWERFLSGCSSSTSFSNGRSWWA